MRSDSFACFNRILYDFLPAYIIAHISNFPFSMFRVFRLFEGQTKSGTTRPGICILKYFSLVNKTSYMTQITWIMTLTKDRYQLVTNWYLSALYFILSWFILQYFFGTFNFSIVIPYKPSRYKRSCAVKATSKGSLWC